MDDKTVSDVPARWLGLPVIATIARILCRERPKRLNGELTPTTSSSCPQSFCTKPTTAIHLPAPLVSGTLSPSSDRR